MKQNIVVLARTLNEERYIERFLRGYEWADTILLADGGSTDRTLDIAGKHSKVQMVSFDKRAPTKSGGFNNPENAHSNFLVDCAMRLNPDWLVMDDLDCVPNYILRAYAREIIESEPLNEIFAYRLYLWKRAFYFPSMMVGKSLWAWRPDRVSIRADERKDPFEMEYMHEFNWLSPRHELETPLVLLHDGWPDDARIDEKMARYASWGRPQTYPLDAFGPAELLPEYARE